jgi:RNA polymerase sigma-B factor
VADRRLQRAETERTLRRLATLPEGHAERERLRTAVIEDHMRYARSIAHRFARNGVYREDLEQVAYLGLVRAVDDFDPEYGSAFLGYATASIVGELKRYFRDATWDVHVPRRLQELTGALRTATAELTAELGRVPTLPELARRLEVADEEVVQALDAAGAYTASSLDRPLTSEDGATTVGETLGEEDPGIELTVDREVLKGLVGQLEERDKRILLMRYFRGMTQAEIGAELGISQMHVSRLLARVLGRLRAGFGEQGRSA